MVNPSILGYLKEGVSRGFSVDRLKEELLKNKFDAKEIDEAVKAMNPVKPLPTSYQSSYSMRILEEKKGSKWMFIAGIIGIIMLILGMIGFSLSVWNLYKASTGVPIMSPAVLNSGTVQGGTPSTAAEVIALPISLPMTIILFLIMLAVFILFYYGFVRMGKYTESNLLRDSSWGIMFTPAIFGVVMLISYFILYKILAGLFAGASTFGIGSTPDFTNIKTLTIILVGVWIAAFLFYMAMQILFSIGLIQAGKQVKFAKIGGILNIIYFVISIVISVYSIIIINNIYQVFASGDVLTATLSGINPFSYLFNTVLTASYIAVAAEFIGLLVLLFCSLALFDASKKFES